jgi:outer membrane protein TolC
LTAGTNYHLHNGNLQRPDGTILGLSEQSLYYGGGAQAIGTQTVAYPAIRIFAHLGDAFFEPLAARQQTVVRQFDAVATFNSTLLNVSTRYLELMAAEAQLEVLHQSQSDAAEVVRITSNFARVGRGRQADADRVTTEATLIESEVQRAQEHVAVAAAELSGLLSLDPSTRLKTVGGPIPVLLLIDPSYRLDQLLDVALRQRPEMAARSARIAEMQTRYRQERTRPWLPTMSIGFSAGGFGGGSNFSNFGARTDFDVIAFWTAQNLGAGNLALWNGRRAQTDEAIAGRVRAVNNVRREVAEAYAQSTARQREMDIQEQRLAAAETGFREELGRIRGGAGLPIELLDNLTRLVAARQAIVATVAAYDQAQFALFVALGQPPTRALPNAKALEAPAHKRL